MQINPQAFRNRTIRDGESPSRMVLHRAEGAHLAAVPLLAVETLV